MDFNLIEYCEEILNKSKIDFDCLEFIPQNTKIQCPQNILTKWCSSLKNKTLKKDNL